MGEVSKGEGRTVLFVSHNMAAVQSLCGKGILISKGNLDYFGGSKDAVQKYTLKDINEFNNESLDISNYRRKNRDPIGEISFVEIHQEYIRIKRIAENEGFSITIFYILFQKVTEVVINLIFKNELGEILLALSSKDLIVKAPSNDGNHSATFNFKESFFMENKIYLDIGLSPGDGGLSFDVIENFPILEINNENKFPFWSERPKGYILLPTNKYNISYETIRN